MNQDRQALETMRFLVDTIQGRTEFIEKCAARIRGADGGKYYDPETDTMLFETMPLDDVYRYTEEEILDIPNYAFMLYARGQGEQARELVVQALVMYETLQEVRSANA